MDITNLNQDLELIHAAGVIQQEFNRRTKGGGVNNIGIGLVNPKYPHNVGAVMRACSCFGVENLWFSGNRVPLTPTDDYRLPREERMRDYDKVKLINSDRFYDLAKNKGLTPIAIERRSGFESLPNFVHPLNALYVFGAEDGDLDRMNLKLCHRFVSIPTNHCVNLAAAVYIVLYDRMIKFNPPS